MDSLIDLGWWVMALWLAGTAVSFVAAVIFGVFWWRTYSDIQRRRAEMRRGQ